jgi:peptidoglycan/xylan/chitin deacetylase (PgdA/CDA1 family)
MKTMLPKMRQALMLFTLVAAVTAMPGCGQGASPTPTRAPTATPVPPPTATPPPPTSTLAAVSPVPTATRQPASPTPPTSSEPVTYVVQQGDTLSAIAFDYGVTVDAIAATNDLTSDVIYPGQVLTIPLGTAAQPPTPTLAASPSVTSTAVASAAPTLAPVEPGLITHGDRSLPYVALTFDACQTCDNPAGYDAAIIDTLVETDTPATLFLGGLWMQSHPTQTQGLAAQPLFELGNHSWSHPDFAEISPEEMSRELLWTQDMMYELTGRQPTLFRLPFGTYTEQALAVVAQHGLRTIQWDVVTGDPDPNISAEDIVRAVTTQAQNGSIVIMHMNTRGWHTAEALPTLIERLRAQGYRFATVSQILGLEPLPTSDAP